MNLRKHIQPKFVLERILTKEKFKIAACDWGIQNEKNALGEYAIKLNLNKTKLENVGLIINPKCHDWVHHLMHRLIVTLLS